MRKVLLFLFITMTTALCGCEDGRRLYMAVAYKVVKNTTNSMLPHIKDGDYAIIDRSFYQYRPVQRFDVVVVRDPEGRKEPNGSDTYYIKRVVGLGGEEVRMSGGKVFINDRVLTEPHPVVRDEAEDFGPLVVPAGEYFLLGDNRPDSYDGRHWAKRTVGKSHVHAKVLEAWSE